MTDKKQLVDYPVIELQLSEIFPNKYNPKKMIDESEENKKEYEKLVKSITMTWYEDKIKVRINEKGKYEIVDGFHRRMALKELWYKQVQVINLWEKTLAQAIADTLSSEEIKVPLDDIEVSKLLKWLKEDWLLIDVMDLLPYSVEEVDLKIDLLDFIDQDKEDDWEEEQKQPSQITVMVICKDMWEAELIKTDLEWLWYKPIIKS